MKKLIARLLLAAALAAQIPAAMAGQFSEKMYITRMETAGASYLKTQFFTDKGTFGCAEPYYMLFASTDNAREIYALLLTAFLANKQIDVWLGDTCDSTYRNVVHVRAYW